MDSKLYTRASSYGKSLQYALRLGTTLFDRLEIIEANQYYVSFIYLL